MGGSGAAEGERQGTTVTGRRCATPRCGRFVRLEEVWCATHRVATGEEPGVVCEAALARREDFQRRLAVGEYRALFETRLREVITQAAAEQGLADEIGALRFVLARLLAEEEDTVRLAAGVARVASVAIQAARAQRAISGERAEALTGAIARLLIELDE